MSYFRPLYPFLLGWVLILSTETFAHLGLINGVGQLLLFAAVVCLPIWLTGRMSYVDIGWPWGLVLLASVSYLSSDGYWLRSLAVTLLVMVVGLRMGLGALNLWRLGLLKKEFPRYQYQRLRWETQGKTNVSLALQVDALSQGLANASFLALPVFIIAANASTSFAVLELLGLTIALLAFGMESVADLQKVRFLQEMKRAEKKLQVCDVGLWRYCRHPNYFAEWMVWNGLVIAALPSWFALQGQENTMLWLLLGVGLLFTSRVMYSTLVYATGAVPAEHYSQRKRPGYSAYQQRTNRFFPGPRKSEL
ncbi:MAG: steroid 5-alpha reductase family enzyme [Candidatus Azotimanducaceae bacterium]|jgi:steroid 5-alpha reductase family enzyme